MAALIEEVTSAEFTALPTQLDCFASRDAQEQLLQWNLDKDLQVARYRFAGGGPLKTAAELQTLLKDFFRNAEAVAPLGVAGSPTVPVTLKAEALEANVMSMDFFDRLGEHIAPNGNIRGCFEDVFEGITVGDLLRECLLNENSENASLFSESDRKQFIFRLFKLLVVGGSMCQPDMRTERYLEMTKGLYKSLVSVFKDSNTESIQVASKVFSIESVEGLELFPSSSSSPHNIFLVVVDPAKRTLTVVKLDYKSFW